MTNPTPAIRQVEVSDDVYDLLARTADSRGTDINGVLRYLLQVPAVSTTPTDSDKDDD